MEDIRAEIEALTAQLSQFIDGDFNFKLNTNHPDEQIQKFVMLINFILNTAQKAISDSAYNNRHLEQIVQNRTFELKLEKEKVERASRAKDQFIANISHELRTPLNAILGTTEILQQRNSDPKTSKMIEILYNSSEHLLYLLNDILDLSKIENDHLELESIPFNLRTELEHVITWFKQRAHEKSITLSLETNINEKDRYLGDPTRIKQISANLINNAIKFTPENGQVSITASLNYLEKDMFEAVISFKDTGIGIPEEAQTKIFEAFTQADNSTTRMYGGTGLGLTICTKLLTKMQGSISLQSKPNDGSNFTVKIPLKIINHASQQMPLLNEVKTNTRLGGTILLAEDNTTNQIVAQELLESLGYELDIANDGLEVLEKVKNNRYDIILMDCHMPNLNGFDATKILRDELDYKGPVIALTADLLNETKEKVYQVGMNDFISKPFNFENLKTLLALHISQTKPISSNKAS